MSATIRSLAIYPVKGLAGMPLEAAELRAGQGIPRDRRFAFRYRDAAATAPLREFPWAPKNQFAVQHDWPGLACLRCALDDGGTELALEDPTSGERVRESVATDAGRATLSRFASRFLARLQPSAPSRRRAAAELELVGSRGAGTRYPDRGKMHVSVLNLASLRDLERAVGRPIDIRRFRGNVIIDGIPAWSEFAWEKQVIEVGGARVEIKAPLLRCHNINVDPETGDDSVGVLEQLKLTFDHTKFGMVGTVLVEGELALDDSVRTAIL